MQVGIGAEGNARLLIGLRNDGGKISRVDNHGKVWPRRSFIVGVDVGVEALSEVGAEGGGEMTASGEAEHTDPMRVEVEIGGVRADDGEGALGVYEGGVRLRVR